MKEDVEELLKDHRKEMSFKELTVLRNEMVQVLKKRKAFGNEKDEVKEKKSQHFSKGPEIGVLLLE